MIVPAPLWAQGFDVIVILIIVFGIIVPLVMQVVEKLKEAQQKAARGGQQQRPAQPQRPADVEDEIGEFLRRAAERRQGGQPAQAQAAPRPAQPPRRLVPQEPAEAVVLLDDPPRHAELSQQVERDLDTRKFADRAKQMERRAEQARRKAEQHTHQVFDHDVGHLGGSSPAPGQPGAPAVALGAEVGPGLAAGLPALLASPVGLRQAIVLTEILERPEHRWG
jgi:hypothetical protein